MSRVNQSVKVCVRALKLVLVAWLLATSPGCTNGSIPNTDVPDNEFNRKVLEFCEDYRHAVERRNIALLMKLAAPSYYEDGGNADASDDLDYAGLHKYLETKFLQTKAIRYEIRYRKISKGDNEVINVDYTYSASYKIPYKGADAWKRTVADNRLQLIPEGDSFRILSGM
ncbi:MAG TPA: hypothetical protein VGJ84_22590 [Polyangiaceae bacterium]|jgi:hypothetical protein